jgi:4-hydroxy-tetrahydrodipicolinate synthase
MIMKAEGFAGTCTAIVTPFWNGEINYPMIEQLLRRQREAGIKTVVVAGTTGESATLSDHEKHELFGRCKDYVGDSMNIIAGTGSNSTEHTVYLSQIAQDAGADGLLVVSPYYNKATEDGLVAHYSAVAQAVSIPVILYNVPSRTGLDISVNAYKRLCRIPNIIGVKEAATDIRKIGKIISQCGNDLMIWSGNDDMTVPILAMGGCGVISVASNVAPGIIAAMTDAGLAGDFDTASALQVALQPLLDALFREVNPVPVKTCMQLLGYDCGVCRLPLTSPKKETIAELQSAIQNINSIMN